MIWIIIFWLVGSALDLYYFLRTNAYYGVTLKELVLFVVVSLILSWAIILMILISAIIRWIKVHWNKEIYKKW